MAAATKIILHLVLLLWGEVHVVQLSVLEQQQNGFIMADVGDTVTFNCSVQDDFRSYYWYKQSFGNKPEPIAVRSKYIEEATIFEKFNNSRFSVVIGEREDHLKISDVQMSDSAVYYCLMQMFLFDIQFKESIMFHVKGSSSSIQAIVQQPPEQSVQPGDSVTLNCTVYTAGTDYAVALCGEIVDGEGEESDCRHQMEILVILSISRTGVVLCIIFVFTIIYMARKYTCQCHVEER